MTDLKIYLAANASLCLAIGGLLIGLAFGALTQRANFCTMGSIASWITLDDARGLRAWALAVAIATGAVAILTAYGALDPALTMYASPRLNWVTNSLGGLMFGFGMVLAGGCASRNLVRAGAGDLRSALTLLVTCLFATMTLGGILGPLRASLEQWTAITLPMPTQRLPDMMSGMVGPSADLVLPLTISLILFAVCFADKPFRTSRRHLAIGVGVGALVAGSWAITGLAYDEFAERIHLPVSLSFVKPSADAFDWLERYTALGMPGFAVASVFGTFLGGALTAYAGGRFRLMAFADKNDTLRHMAGAALMGIGGVLAAGCSIGQGISGLSTLSIGSILATGGIIGGTVIGIKWLQDGDH